MTNIQLVGNNSTPCFLQESLLHLANTSPPFRLLGEIPERPYSRLVLRRDDRGKACDCIRALSVKDQAPLPLECRGAEQRLKSYLRNILTFLKSFASPPSMS